MMNQRVYYAKQDQTYEDHVNEVYKAWKKIIMYKSGLIDRVARSLGFSKDEFVKLSLLTILMHDLGKLIQVFQSNMQALREHRTISYSKNYRHELCSLPYLFSIKNEIVHDPILKFPFELLSVAGHHKILDITQRSFEREKCFIAEPQIPDDALLYALNVIKPILINEGVDISSISIDQLYKLKGKGYSLFNSIMVRLSQLVKIYDSSKCRTIYSLIKGILHYADWCGSAGEEVNYAPQLTPADLIYEVKRRCESRNITYKGLRRFQEDLSNIRGNCIAIAPTGSGKTEASILWALTNIEDMGYAKIIYLLPTMATANSMWRRLADLFGSDNVGLAHSSAHLYFNNEEEVNEYVTGSVAERNMLFDRAFIRPVTVATVDQLLNTGYHAKNWTIKETNAMNSVIILDEIHAYDGWTMGLIIKTIAYMSRFGTRFLLMSATMPQYIIDLFSCYLKGCKLVQDKELLELTRSKYYFDERIIQDAYSDIIDAVESGKKVLVVVNTVGLCQQIASDLKNYNPICYHSRFIQKDRKAIEKKLEEARFVIATQIVEVSLDIDYDWLFTECAPPDAIAQRAGRINRYRDNKRDSRVIIFRPSEKSEELYNPIEDPNLLSRTIDLFQNVNGDAINEQKLLDIINEVYDDFHIEAFDSYQEAIKMYEKGQKARLFVLDNSNDDNKDEKTRLEKYSTISVIPFRFYDEALKANPADRAMLEVKIPYWYFIKHQKVRDGLAFCDLLYDEFLGARLEQDKSSLCL